MNFFLALRPHLWCGLLLFIVISFIAIEKDESVRILAILPACMLYLLSNILYTMENSAFIKEKRRERKVLPAVTEAKEDNNAVEDFLSWKRARG